MVWFRPYPIVSICLSCDVLAEVDVVLPVEDWTSLLDVHHSLGNCTSCGAYDVVPVVEAEG